MKKENAYAFREKLLKIHEENIGDISKRPRENELILSDGVVIEMMENPSEVIKTAALDFADYLTVSMGLLNVSVKEGFSAEENTVKIYMAQDECVKLGVADGYQGFLIEAEDCVKIYAHDERGAAQALFYLEDLMSFRKAPFIEKKEIRKKAMFSPQMVHSSYGLDEFPDNYLARIAHEGRDAILVFTKDVNQTPSGFLDFNDLIKRAAKYGIDVYSYSYYLSDMSPEAEGAEEYYDNSYGRLFRECPGLKGVVLVGESVEFPSRDPHVTKGRYYETAVDGIPSEKVSSGWYPCEDYPIWLNLIKKVVRKYNSDADIVFWTYNWGYQPEDARIKLIESLPTDISLQATFEMFELRKYGSVSAHCADYTLSFEGPGKYFESEAKAAKKRGITLYSMVNTGGLTWDMGVIPYEPMPYQWIKRYEAMKKAKDEWGLSGIMESHHFGFYPSFISKLSKWIFMEPERPSEEILAEVLKGEFGEKNYETVNEALKLWSEAITYYTATDADQYGAFRVGPSYPFCLDREIPIPSDPDAMFGNSICFPFYVNVADPRDTILNLRLPEEIKSLDKMCDLMQKGLSILQSVPNINDKIEELINLGLFIIKIITTANNAKKWYVLKTQFRSESTKEGISDKLDEMEKLLHEEIENAKSAISLVEENSRLGWEPSMLYIADKWHIEWKIRQINHVLSCDIARYRECLENSDK